MKKQLWVLSWSPNRVIAEKEGAGEVAGAKLLKAKFAEVLGGARR